MQNTAPYANTAIILSLSSITGLKYRAYNCVECGQPILERNGELMFRFTNGMPQEAHVSADGTILARCDQCKQQYTVTISQVVVNQFSNLPLYMQPQALFMAIEPAKKMRDTHCLECGHAFYSVSDRIKMLVDNVVPFEMLDPARLGPMEARCKFQHCKQRWSVMA